MSQSQIEVNTRQTFTVERLPRNEAGRKTLRRLMRMQPHIQKGLRKLAKRRQQTDNRTVTRAGVDWVIRVPTTKLTYVREGESFTLDVTPQIAPDLRSVEPYLKVESAN